MSTRKASFIAGFFVLVIVSTVLPGARHLLAQDQGDGNNATAPGVAQFVALDECDPTTFNAALGPAFCKNGLIGWGGASTEGAIVCHSVSIRA